MSGTWREIDNPWYESRIINCAFCGQMIARHTYVASLNGQDEHYCSETCAARAREARDEERTEAH
jgi:hypothetical protein